jgi:ribosomal protein S27AE
MSGTPDKATYLADSNPSKRLFEALMQFCPRCGVRLTKPDEPAECGKCGWREQREDNE